MQSPIYDLSSATRHGFIPLDDQESEIPHAHAHTISDNDEKDAHEIKHFQRPKAFKLIFIAFCLSEFTRAIDAAILPVILPGIVKDLSASTSEGYLSGSSFLLFQTVFQPVYKGFAGALGDKICFLAAITTFAGASILTGFAQNPYWLIGARALQGAGAGGMDVMCGIMMVKMVPLSERGKYTGFLQLFGATGLVAGMLLAAVVVTKLTWRWVFFVNPFLVVVPATIITLFFNNFEQPKFRKNIKLMDWSGMVIVALSCSSLLFGLLTGGAISPWNSPKVLVPLLLGAVGAVVFVLHQAYFVERFTPAEPLIPLRLFGHRTSAAGYVAALLHAICMAAVANFFFIYVHVSKSFSILGTSAAMLPSSGLLFSSAALTGYVTSKKKIYKVFVVVGGVLIAGGAGSFIHLLENNSLVELLLLQVIFAVGAGILFPARMLATQAPQRPSDTPAASAVLSFIFNLGQCFGIPIGATTYESVWSNLLDKDVKSGLIPAQYIITSSNAEASGEIIAHWPKAIAEIYRHLMAVSISNIWIVLTAFGGVITVMGLIMMEVPLIDREVSIPLRRKPEDEHEDTVRLISAGA